MKKIDVASITAVLLHDGWYTIVPGTFKVEPTLLAQEGSDITPRQINFSFVHAQEPEKIVTGKTEEIKALQHGVHDVSSS